MSGVGCGAGIARACGLMVSLPPHDDGGAAVTGAQRPPRTVGQRHVAVLHLHLRMSLTAQLPHGLHYLGEAPAVRRMVVAEPAPVGVEGELAHARDEVAVRHELASLALRT